MLVVVNCIMLYYAIEPQRAGALDPKELGFVVLGAVLFLQVMFEM